MVTSYTNKVKSSFTDNTIRTAIIHYYLPNRILDKRWLAAIPFLVSLLAYSAFEILSIAYQIKIVPNIWELIVGVINNRPIIYHGLINMFIYLVSDIGFLRGFELQILLRIGSRNRWFLSQMICMFFCVTIYFLLILFVTFLIAFSSTRLSMQWETFILKYIGKEGFPTVLLTLSPPITVFLMVSLLWMAWLFIGTVTICITTYTQRPMLGFLGGVFLNYSSFIVTQSGSNWLGKLFFSNPMFLWKNKVLSNSITMDFLFSCLYWFVLICTSVIIFKVISQSTNFLSQHHAE